MPSVLDLLRPQNVTAAVNEIQTPYDRLQDYYGMKPKGKNCVRSELRNVAIDVVNDDRKVATFTAPGADATWVAPLVIGSRTVTAPRGFEKISIPQNLLNELRGLGESALESDSSESHSLFRANVESMMRRFRRQREFQIWGMQRGSFQFILGNNEWTPVLSGGDVTIDYRKPADHLGQAGGIIATAWSDTANATPVTDLVNITAKSESDTGLIPTEAWCNTKTWITLLNTTQVRNMGGSANTSYEDWRRVVEAIEGGKGKVGSTRVEATGTLKALPTVTWHITDRVISVNGTTRKYYNDGELAFHPLPDRSWTFGYEVKETIQTGPEKTENVYGFASWTRQPVDVDTPHWLMYFLDNFFPTQNPSADFFLTTWF